MPHNFLHSGPSASQALGVRLASRIGLPLTMEASALDSGLSR